MDEYKEIPLKLILDDPAMPNKIYRTRSAHDLEASLRNGQEQPLWVRPAPDGKFYLMDGYRRRHALNSIGAETAFVLVKDATDDEVARFMMISDLKRPQPDVVLNKEGEIIGGRAWSAMQISQRLGLKNYEIADLLTDSTPNIVGAYLALFDESVEVRRAVAEGAMAITTYSLLRRKSDELKQAMIEKAERSKNGKVSAGTVRKAIRQSSGVEGAMPYIGVSGLTQKLNEFLSFVRTAQAIESPADIDSAERIIARLEELLNL